LKPLSINEYGAEEYTGAPWDRLFSDSLFSVISQTGIQGVSKAFGKNNP
jgi:hypothetical protein